MVSPQSCRGPPQRRVRPSIQKVAPRSLPPPPGCSRGGTSREERDQPETSVTSRRPLSRLRSAASEAATACWPHASLKRTHSTMLAAHLVGVGVGIRVGVRVGVRVRVRVGLGLRVRVRARARARVRARVGVRVRVSSPPTPRRPSASRAPFESSERRERTRDAARCRRRHRWAHPPPPKPGRRRLQTCT